MVILSTDLNR